MPHQDTYGRFWRYQPHPDHDLSQALQISHRVAEFIAQTDFRRCGYAVKAQEVDPDAEPYLYKTPLGDWDLWIRVGHGGLDYHLLDDIDPRIISLALEMHGKGLDTPAEAKAYDALVPAPQTLSEAWEAHTQQMMGSHYDSFSAGFAAGERAK